MRTQVFRWALVILFMLLLRGGDAGAFQLLKLRKVVNASAKGKSEGRHAALPPLQGRFRDGLVGDMINAACLSAVGDVSAQVLESVTSGKPLVLDLARARRFLFFGFLDGAVAHTWYYGADKLIRGNTAPSVVLKIAADTLIFTPLWCAWFLTCFHLLDRQPAWEIGVKLRSQWFDMAKLSSRLFVPMALVLYTAVPTDRRAFVAAAGTMMATTLVSMWKSISTSSMTAASAVRTAGK